MQAQLIARDNTSDWQRRQPLLQDALQNAGRLLIDSLVISMRNGRVGGLHETDQIGSDQLEFNPGDVILRSRGGARRLEGSTPAPRRLWPSFETRATERAPQDEAD